MTLDRAQLLAAMVARTLRETLAQPVTIASLRIEAARVGATGAEMDRVIARWQAMLERRESGEAPVSIRGAP